MTEREREREEKKMSELSYMNLKGDGKRRDKHVKEQKNKIQ